jgi:hypothetical protein
LCSSFHLSSHAIHPLGYCRYPSIIVLKCIQGLSMFIEMKEMQFIILEHQLIWQVFSSQRLWWLNLRGVTVVLISELTVCKTDIIWIISIHSQITCRETESFRGMHAIFSSKQGEWISWEIFLSKWGIITVVVLRSTSTLR